MRAGLRQEALLPEALSGSEVVVELQAAVSASNSMSPLSEASARYSLQENSPGSVCIHL